MNEKRFIKLPETPVKDSLEPELQNIIENRYQKTNDDNTQEDMAIKIVTDGEFLDHLMSLREQADTAYIELANGFDALYKKQATLSKYLNLFTDFDHNVANLLEDLSILEMQKEFFIRSNLERNEENKKQILDDFQFNINDIKKSLNQIKNREISEHSVGEILEAYLATYKKYIELYKILNLENPRLN